MDFKKIKKRKNLNEINLNKIENYINNNNNEKNECYEYLCYLNQKYKKNFKKKIEENSEVQQFLGGLSSIFGIKFSNFQSIIDFFHKKYGNLTLSDHFENYSLIKKEYRKLKKKYQQNKSNHLLEISNLESKILLLNQPKNDNNNLILKNKNEKIKKLKSKIEILKKENLLKNEEINQLNNKLLENENNNKKENDEYYDPLINSLKQIRDYFNLSIDSKPSDISNFVINNYSKNQENNKLLTIPNILNNNNFFEIKKEIDLLQQEIKLMKKDINNY